jgi:hypothetical protein
MLSALGCSSDAPVPSSVPPTSPSPTHTPPPALAPPAPISFGSVGLSESAWPLLFQLEILNSGDDTQIDHVSLDIANKVLILRSADPAPDGFDYHINLLSLSDQRNGTEPSGHSIPVSWSGASISGSVHWLLPPSTPPMLAVLSARFVVSREGKVLRRSEPMVFLLESGPGVLQSVITSPSPNSEQAASLLRDLGQLEGEQTADFLRLLQSLREVAGESVN